MKTALRRGEKGAFGRHLVAAGRCDRDLPGWEEVGIDTTVPGDRDRRRR